MGVIFLKYFSDGFEEHSSKLDAERLNRADPEDPDEYQAFNIFWVLRDGNRSARIGYDAGTAQGEKQTKLIDVEEKNITERDEDIDFLEEHIPELAEAAVTQAYWHTLTSGNSVLESENGVIYEVFPDGTRKVVKTVEPPVHVGKGEKRLIA